MKTAIVTDSSACISKEYAHQLGVYVTRMPLTVDGNGYIEEETMSRQELIQAMLDGATVSTSQPNILETTEFFKTLLQEYAHIIYLPISSRLSGTYQTAKILEAEFSGRLTVVDTLFVSWPLTVMTIQAKKMADQGIEPSKIKEILEQESYMYASLIPEDIQYLKRGGRIKPAAAAIANLLKIIPVLKVAEGEIDLVEKVRTRKKAVKEGTDIVLKLHPNVADYHWAVLDGGCDETTFNEVVARVKSVVGDDVHVGQIYPIVLAHTGPGTIAVTAVKKVGIE